MQSTQAHQIRWIENNHDFQEMTDHLLKQSIIGVDTESNSLFVYYEKVCLIQFSTVEFDFLVDPFAIRNLQPLNDIFCSPDIEKVFHAAEYDIMCLKRDFKFEFANLFDTMIASRVLGKKAIGLSSLLETYFGITTDKRYQRANWGKRPLPADMLNYASMDSRYLIDLRNLVMEELVSAGLMELAQEDFRRICATDPFHAHKNGDQCWKMVKGNHISPKQMAVLMELCNFRISIAKSRNIPEFKVMGSDALVEIARACPTTLDELSILSGISAKIIERYGEDILRGVQKGLLNEPVARQYKSRPDMAFVARSEALKTWRKKTAGALNVESDIILPKEFVESIAQKNPKTLEALNTILVDVPYRQKKFGKDILDVLLNLEWE